MLLLSGGTEFIFEPLPLKTMHKTMLANRTIEVIDQIWNQRFAADNFYRSQKNWDFYVSALVCSNPKKHSAIVAVKKTKGKIVKRTVANIFENISIDALALFLLFCVSLTVWDKSDSNYESDLVP